MLSSLPSSSVHEYWPVQRALLSGCVPPGFRLPAGAGEAAEAQTWGGREGTAVVSYREDKKMLRSIRPNSSDGEDDNRHDRTDTTDVDGDNDDGDADEDDDKDDYRSSPPPSPLPSPSSVTTQEH